MRRFRIRTATAIYLVYLALAATLLFFTSQDFPSQVHFTFHSSLERLWAVACLFVPVSVAFFIALWTGLGHGSFLHRIFIGTPIAILSWIVFRMLAEIQRTTGDTSEGNLILIVVYPAAIWILSVACFFCLRILPLTRWQIVAPPPTAGTDHKQPHQFRPVTNVLMITCTWLTLFYLLKMCHQWHSVFNPLDLPEKWEPIKNVANHAIRFIPFILLAPALTLTSRAGRILYRKRWFPVVLVLGIALSCFAAIATGFHYMNPKGEWFVYGLSSIAIPLLLLGRSGYRIQRHPSTEEVDAQEQGPHSSWQGPHVAALLAVLTVSLVMIPTGKLHNLRRHLYLSNFYSHQDAMVVNDNGQITSLTFGMHTTNDIMREQLSGLTDLEELGISSLRITDDSLKHLQQMPHLKYLNLGIAPYVTGSGLRYLHKSCQLTTMFGGLNGFSDNGLKELRRHNTLERLFLWDTSITDSGLAHLAELMKLHTLDLRNTKITDAGLAHLVKLMKLHTLDLSNTKITDAGLIHLKGLTNLKSLQLWGTRVSDAGLKSLKGFELDGLGIPDEATTNLGLKNYLAAIKSAPGLYLYKWKITDAGLEHLKGQTHLQDLNLSATKITDAGLAHLKGLSNLESLDLTETKVTEKGVTNFKKLLPSCNISY